VNQREADVAVAFRRAVDDIAAQRPDAVIIAGDVFHSVRPTNAAILDAFSQLKRLRDLLPDAAVVIVAGNHDTPRSLETGSILRLFENVGVSVAWHEAKRFVFERQGLAVLAVPTSSWLPDQPLALEPDPDSRVNVLATHREVDGVIPEHSAMREYGMAPIDVRALHTERFDYVALGHYHVAHAVAPNAWYAGSLEYVSSNPWSETAEEADGAPPKTPKGAKGWLSVELEGGKAKPAVAFRRLELARRFLDLPPIKGANATAQDLDRVIGERVKDAGGIADAVARQVVYDVTRLVAREVSHEQLRKLRASALHYLLDLRRPQGVQPVGVSARGERKSLGDTVADYIGKRPLDAGLNRQRLVELGRKYLADVERELVEP